MEIKINIEAANGMEAKRIKDIMARAHACKFKTLSAPITSREPIHLGFACPKESIDGILDTLQEPHILAKLMPDEISLSPKWSLPKRRKIQ